MGIRLARHWWVLALRGAIAIILGLVALFWPAMTLIALLLLFAGFAFVGGLFLAIAAFADGLNHRHAWTMLLEGLIGILIGLWAFIWPGLTGLFLVYLVAAWAIITGIFEIIASFQIRQEIQNEWLLTIAGISSVIFGILLIAWPMVGAIALLWVIAIYAIILGVLLLILAFRLRSWETSHRVY